MDAATCLQKTRSRTSVFSFSACGPKNMVVGRRVQLQLMICPRSSCGRN